LKKFSEAVFLNKIYRYSGLVQGQSGNRFLKEAAMKTNFFDDIVRGVVVGTLLLFGLRAVLPQIVQSGQLSALFGFGGLAILTYAIGRYTAECKPACDPEVCRTM